MKQIIEMIGKAGSFKDIEISQFAPADAWADRIAKELGSKMKATQLRKVFSTIKSLEQRVKAKNEKYDFNEPDLLLLIPNLAYAKARKPPLITDDFYKLMKAIIGDGRSGKIKKNEDYLVFTKFMTAIVAFHKQYDK